jgi:hypothetical protein
MRILPCLFALVIQLGCAGSRQVGATEPIIDTTSFDTISRSIAAAKPEDQQIVGVIPCDLGHKLGLDPSDPEQRELLLEQLRVEWRGKTVAQVAAEVRAQHKSESDKLQKFAEDFVGERQVKWKNRADHVSLVTTGTKEEDILKYFGDPDSKADNGTTKSWFYWISATVKDGQICEEAISLKIEGGVVVNLRQFTGYREGIDAVYKKSQK